MKRIQEILLWFLAASTICQRHHDAVVAATSASCSHSSVSASASLLSSFRTSSSSSISSSNSRSTFTSRLPFVLSVATHLRGGAAAASTTTTTATSKPATDASTIISSTKAYRLQQQLHLQSRSLQLRQELIMRGLDALRHGGAGDGSESAAVKKAVDWDCALSTRSHPKTCLFSFDAEENAKVIAPIDTTQWITLSSLNRLRRSDVTKVEPLWHSQYAILTSWFHPSSQYSLYSHLSPTGTALSLLLDVPWLLATVIFVSFLTLLLVTLPIWEHVLTAFLTSRFLWLQWPNWGRFVHAALPLKLLLGQMAWRAVAVSFGKVYHQVRSALVEWECQIYQDCIPLTIVENKKQDGEATASAILAEEEIEEDEREDEEDADDDDDDDDED